MHSPVRKRMRLSSPTYDDQLDDLDANALETLDYIEFSMSQSSNSSITNLSRKRSHQMTIMSQDARQRRMQAITEGLSQEDTKQKRLRAIEQALMEMEEEGHPSEKEGTRVVCAEKTSTGDFGGCSAIRPATSSPSEEMRNKGDGGDLPRFSSASSLRQSVSPFKPESEPSLSSQGNFFTTARDVRPSPSPEEPLAEFDVCKWFEPIQSDHTALPGFQRVSTAIVSDTVAEVPSSTVAGFSSGAAAFTLASGKPKVIEPSKAALELAARKMQEWHEEDVTSEDLLLPSLRLSETIGNHTTSSRPVLGSLDNSLDPEAPDSPSPAGNLSHKQLSLSSALDVSKATGRNRGFKSPLISSHSSMAHYPRPVRGALNSPLNPNRSTKHQNQNTRPQLPVSTPLTKSPQRQSASFTSVIPRTGSTAAFNSAGLSTPLKTPSDVPAFTRQPPKAKFSTPFKQGMKPGERGRDALLRNLGNQTGDRHQESRPTHHEENPPNPRNPFKTNNTKLSGLETRPTKQKTLQSSGLVPHNYSVDQLESMGINVSELSQINIETAIYYSFHTDSCAPSCLPSTAVTLGTAAALDQLLRRGCRLATKEWVDNHWSLILWKLAGMVCLDPERELGPEKRWCWGEVMRQLMYRYEREINRASRPPFKLITTHDAPASSPMVLCVSNITWTEERITKDGSIIKAHPELEVTDGWYRLRAQVDEPLARAARRGLITIGRKIGVAGARLNSRRKSPEEVLEAYSSTNLVFSGNSTHLAPWHAKLGFQEDPFIATLSSLTGDGGAIATMNLTVVKTYPVAFLEFREGENGKKIREGPRTESEEAQVNDKWKDQRDAEESKLREVLAIKWTRWEGYADRLERIAAGRFQPNDDDMPPDYIEDLFEELESSSDASLFMKRLSYEEAGWLSQYIIKKCSKDRELSADEIEMELKHLCPPREVRNFRVIVVRDARNCKRPAHRKAQLTVWDVLSLSLTEGGAAGDFREGQRFVVTNLMPSQPGAWMASNVDSEVYLSTRRDTRWNRIR